MPIKSILCIFEGGQEELDAVYTALLLAKAFRARVRFLHISPSPYNYIGLFEDGVTIRQDMVQAMEEQNTISMEKAKHIISMAAAKLHVPLDAKEFVNHHASAYFIHRTGDADSIIGKEGMASDIIILSYSVKNDNIIAALFNSGRPVLLLPEKQENKPHEFQDKIIAIAWDSSMEAARAIRNSMPILKRAEKLYLLTAGKSGKIDEDISAYNPIIEYMFDHGLKPDHIILDYENRHMAEAVLDKATQLRADLIVMGAYSHSRFREVMLGGFTMYMLERSNIPLLLSH